MSNEYEILMNAYRQEISALKSLKRKLAQENKLTNPEGLSTSIARELEEMLNVAFKNLDTITFRYRGENTDYIGTTNIGNDKMAKACFNYLKFAQRNMNPAPTSPSGPQSLNLKPGQREFCDQCGKEMINGENIFTWESPIASDGIPIYDDKILCERCGIKAADSFIN